MILALSFSIFLQASSHAPAEIFTMTPSVAAVSATQTSAAKKENPNDRKDIVRQQVNDGIDKAAFLKLAVSEIYLADNDHWPESNDAAGYRLPADLPFDIQVGEKGVITITYKSPAEISGKSLVLTPSTGEEAGTVYWSCKSSGVPDIYLPKSCK